MSQSLKIEITDKDIERTEKLFFPEGGSFKDDKNQRYDFIKCVDKSINVQACPGSGKTTCLLAKLYILSEKMPFENNKGICVLTHTNVAIDLIKEKLGDKADKLVAYPNFFGTIQSFVDKFLAIPACSLVFDCRPDFIDTSIQKKRMEQTYVDNKNFWYWNKVNDIFGAYTFKIDENGKHQLWDYRRRKAIPIIKPPSKTGQDWSEKEKERIIDAAVNLKIKVITKDRVLSYDDAYWLAELYLQDCSMISEIFAERFKYVYFDEGQDTYSFQKEIIEKLFRDEVIIQWIGDVNQGIMNDNESDASWDPGNSSYEKMEITNTRRCSQSIANILKTVSLRNYAELQGVRDYNLKPHIIFYDENTILRVYDHFIGIIKENNLDEIVKESGNPIKAIAWVAKDNENKLTISSYGLPYNKVAVSRKLHYPNLYSFISVAKELSPKVFYRSICNIVIESLRHSDIDKVDNSLKLNKTGLLKYLEEKNLLTEFNENIATYILASKKGNRDDLFDNLCSYLESIVTNHLHCSLKKRGREYLQEKVIKEIILTDGNEINCFRSKRPDLEHIKVQIGTVHSAKGETHTATLYLETKYQKKTCGEYLVDHILGQPYVKKKETYKQQALKIAHVGFSRPTHLLCIALNKKFKDKFKGKDDFILIDVERT